eukprot:3102080-Amphidinium_carterae.2
MRHQGSRDAIATATCPERGDSAQQLPPHQNQLPAHTVASTVCEHEDDTIVINLLRNEVARFDPVVAHLT